MKKIYWFRLIYILLILAILGLYCYEVFMQDKSPTENLLRTVLIAATCVIGLIRTFNLKSRRSLKFYESQYSEIIGNAFANKTCDRKKLLKAIRFYNEAQYNKSVKLLANLKKKCKTKDDLYAVLLFAARCYTDAQMYNLAVGVYNQMITSRVADARVYSNLGYVYSLVGDTQNARNNYHRSLQLNGNNEYAYNNIAQLYFDEHNFEEAISNAEMALKISPKLYQASTLLAIIYALTGEKELETKYFHIAVSSGQNPESLRNAIRKYKNSEENPE